MSKINVLDSNTINQIAAGEVIERPASVVKELVENAIDAGANAVTVEIKDGGISFMRITDNGSGIEEDDLSLVFLRHSTSKIKTAEDLLSVTSLGFRGEALSSIAAIAQVELVTKTSDAFAGIRYQIAGGEEKGLEHIGCPNGTTFIIRNIFFNTPARRKFLKSPTTEAGYISDLMERMAISHPNISFKFINNNQIKLHTSGNNNLKDIIYNVYGREISAQLLYIEGKNEQVSIEGFVAKPIVSRGNRNYENYFINGRYIKSNLIYKAIEEAFKPYTMTHRYPFTSLHLHINSDLIDVNVHPAKLEIRFKNSDELYHLILHTLKNALEGKELIPEVKLTEQKEQAIRKQMVPEPFELNRRNEENKNNKTNGINGSPIAVTEIGKLNKVITTASSLIKENTNYSVQNKKQDDLNDRVFPKQLISNKIQTVDKNETLLKNGSVTNENLGNVIEKNINSYNGMEQSNIVQNDIAQTDNPQTKIIAQKDNIIDINITENNIEQNNIAQQAIIQEDISQNNIEQNNIAQAIIQEDISQNNIEQNNIAQKAIVQENISQNNNAQNDIVQISQNDKDQPGKNSNQDVMIQKPEQLSFISEEAKLEHRIIGQVFSTYWLVEYGDKLFMIDQHAAHEKVLYEKTMKALKEKQFNSQQLEPPLILTLSMREQEVVKKYVDQLNKIGFEFEEFGGKDYAFRAVPSDLYGLAKQDILIELIDGLVNEVYNGTPEIILEKIASLSCKAAVKGNHKLSAMEADALINQLLTLENPYFCPHGRPTIISMSKYELEKKFKRII